jgi:hypothetical protein
MKVRSGKGPVKPLELDVKGIRIATLKAEKAKGMPFTGVITILDGLANLAVGVAIVIVLGIPTLIVMSVRKRKERK